MQSTPTPEEVVIEDRPRKIPVRTRNFYFSFLRHSLSVALICALCCMITIGTGGVSIYFVITMFSAQIVLAALWAVWGPGDYLQRLFWSHLVILGPCSLGIAPPFFLLSMKAGLSGTFEVMFITVLGIPVVSWSAQLPFWFVRYWSGFRIEVYGDSTKGSATIRDIMVFMCLSGLAFGAPQLAVDVTSSAQHQQPAQLQSDSEISALETVSLHRSVYLASLYSYFAFAAFFFLLSLSSLMFIHAILQANRHGGAGRRLAYGLLILCCTIPLTGCLLTLGFGSDNLALRFFYSIPAWAIFLLPFLPTLILGVLAEGRLSFEFDCIDQRLYKSPIDKMMTK